MSDNAPGCAVITGGAGGIGIAAARRLAARGMRVALWDKSSEAIEIAGCIEGALALEVDVTTLAPFRLRSSRPWRRREGLRCW